MTANDHFTTNMNMNENNRTELQAYRETIESKADQIEEQIELDFVEDVHHHIHSKVDNSQYIIYTQMHLKVLEYCENEPEEFKHMISNDDSYREVLQSLAYCAMKNDLTAELRDRDLL